MGIYGVRVDINSPFFRRTSDDATIVRQRAEMALSTKRGTYWTAPDYGFDPNEMVNAEVTAEAFARLSASIKSALASDSILREAAIAVGVTAAAPRPEGLEVTFSVAITLPDRDPVRLAVKVSAAGAEVS